MQFQGRNINSNHAVILTSLFRFVHICFIFLQSFSLNIRAAPFHSKKHLLPHQTKCSSTKIISVFLCLLVYNQHRLKIINKSSFFYWVYWPHSLTPTWKYNGNFIKRHIERKSNWRERQLRFWRRSIALARKWRTTKKLTHAPSLKLRFLDRDWLSQSDVLKMMWRGI